ncbi:MAG: SDR family NAD(P)-dependent oxidoreductase [Fusobacteriaceae bacterium]|nr:SDR family NAD(P)-dependent oxidoreductase [Fusobacteriaceae bacterium]MBN2839262.1 SDR family NAD(P)-dependent oxidoreductase [Fusobacteriaceae bacterium]
MNINSNTILITGGTSGIGLELASKLISLGNTVIVTGRDQKKLDEVKNRFSSINIFKCDVSKQEEIENFYEEVIKQFPNLNFLINNAGIVQELDFKNNKIDLNKINSEIAINLTGSIQMASLFSKHLQRKKTSAILNVSSALAFVPVAMTPVYSATKAAIHSFSQSLRIQLKETNVKVFEVAPPVIKTPLMDRLGYDHVKGSKPMEALELVEVIIKNLKDDNFEILPGQSKILKLISRIAPNFIVNNLNK